MQRACPQWEQFRYWVWPDIFLHPVNSQAPKQTPYNCFLPDLIRSADDQPWETRFLCPISEPNLKIEPPLDCNPVVNRIYGNRGPVALRPVALCNLNFILLLLNTLLKYENLKKIISKIKNRIFMEFFKNCFKLSLSIRSQVSFNFFYFSFR